MSRRTGRRDPIEEAAIKRMLRCPDCDCRVRLTYDRDGRRTAQVTHSPTCTHIPAANRTRGETTYQISDPLLVTLNQLLEEGDDDGRV